VKSVGDTKMDLEVHALRKGQVATFEVEGGFVRRPAPCDGLLVETSSSTILVPVPELARALQELKKPRQEMGASERPVPPKGGWEVSAIRKGQLATFEVEGGFSRRAAPCDGLLVETSTTNILVPLTEVAKTLNQLKKGTAQQSVESEKTPPAPAGPAMTRVVRPAPEDQLVKPRHARVMRAVQEPER
jgi:hypothetical protein